MEASMKRMGVAATIALTVGLVACGGGTSSMTRTTNPATGAWSETLASMSNQQLGSFTFNMMQNNTALTGSGMNFGNMGSLAQCFGNGTMMSGTMMNGQMSMGMMNGGTITMTMSWTPSGSMETNTITMQGTMAMGMGSGSGTFTLTGQTPGCTSQTGTA
jgi:hypothetical protein